MIDPHIEQEMEIVSKELDKCERIRHNAVDDIFWQQMSYIVLIVTVLCLGISLVNWS